MTKSEANFTITAEMLGLSDIQIDHIEIKRNNTIHIQVSSTRANVPCRRCGKPTESHGHSRPLSLRHFPVLDHQVYIEITPRRGICKHCDDHPTTTETLAWYRRNGHRTKPYEDYLMLQLIGSTLTDVSKKESLTEEVLQSVIDRYPLSSVNWKSIKRIGLLGIDEISLKKGHQDYVTLISGYHQGKKQLLAVIAGKEKGSVANFATG